MTPAWLAGRGLVSSLGPDLAGAVSALRDRRSGRVMRSPAEGFTWPFQAIADTEADWWTRAERLVRAAAGSLGGDRRGPLFIASSSVDVGSRDHGGGFETDFHHFTRHVAAWLGWQGPVFTVSTACTSASNAVLAAAGMVRRGEATDALVLGIELANRLTLAGFGSMQLLSPTGALPLAAGRNGLELGEAVAALHVSATPSRWRIAGGANVVDGSDPAGAVAGAVAAMTTRALADSGLRAGDIDLVKLQAAGSVANDRTEVDGLKQVFPSGLPPLVSLKAALGHTLGASGAAEIALLTAALEQRVWPSVPGESDPTLDAALSAAAPPRVRHVLANILGFGGGHAAVVLEDTATR